MVPKADAFRARAIVARCASRDALIDRATVIPLGTKNLVNMQWLDTHR